MTHYTEAQYLALISKQALSPVSNGEADPGPESVLGSKIVAWAKERNYPCLYFPQTKAVRNFLPPGWVDVILALPEGRTAYFELKAKGGKLSDDQKAMRLALMYLGHEWYEVRSFRNFLEIVNRKG